NGRLVRQATRKDYVFAIEYRWSETLTDLVTQEGMRNARAELADFLLGVAADTFEEAVGNDYDGSALFNQLRTEGKPWLAESTDFAFLYCATHKGKATRAGLWDGLADVCARRGLNLKAQGKFLDQQGLAKACDDF